MRLKPPKKAISIVIVIVLLLGFFVYRYFAGKNKLSFETVTVTRGSIKEEVIVTGSVKPAKSVSLAFEKSGRIAFVGAEVGDKISVGEAIAGLEKTDLLAQLNKAEADLLSQRADSNKAKIDLSNYYGDIANVLNDAYAKSEDAVRQQLNGAFSNSESQNPILTFAVKDISIDNDVRRLRFAAT